MKSKTKKTVAAISVAAGALIIFFCWYFFVHNADPGAALVKIQEAMGENTYNSDESFCDQLVKALQKYYSKNISDKSVQANLITVRDFVISTHPKNGRELFYNIIRRAFPGYADEIMATLAKLDEYNRWLAENKTKVSQTVMEEKRKELFGDEAEKIWSGGMLAMEARKVKMQNFMADLNKTGDMTLDEKLDKYQNALRDTYRDTPEGFYLDQKEMLSRIFFSIDSVQDKLKQMSPEERQQEINNVRAQMGMDERLIEQLAQQDAEHEQRWNVGLAYMQERNSVVENYSGAEQKEKLQELREKYFHNEANTIEREEDNDNFFRFQRPHIYGRN
ncbi:MAG TPA: hypothetical protein VMU29_07055 [Smithella sp.]|nr:hypothetical protein [Smithella sp.]